MNCGRNFATEYRTFTYEDEARERLTVERTPEGAAVIRADPVAGVRVLAEHAVTVAQELCDRAGARVVILERPEPRDLLVIGPHGDEQVSVTVSGSRESPGVRLAADPIRLLGDEPLRVALALVDAMAGAQASPGPADVEALAAVIGDKCRVDAHLGSQWDAGVTFSSNDMARAVLAALPGLGWKREEA
jgi:hypothetical protein